MDYLIKSENLRGHKLGSSINFFLRNSYKEAKRKKLYFCLAILSTLIVVTATAVSQTLISYAPLIFLKIAESDSGAIDVKISPTTVFLSQKNQPNSQISKRLFFNTTQVSNLLEPIFPNIATPRFAIESLIFSPYYQRRCIGKPQSYDLLCRAWNGRLLLQDTKKEKDLKIGVGLPLPEKIPQGFVIISTKLASLLNANVGDQIIVQANIGEILGAVVGKYNLVQQNITLAIDERRMSNIKTNFTLTVFQIVGDLSGKFPDGEFNDIMLYEYKYFFPLITQSPPRDLREIPNSKEFLEFLKQEVAENYAEDILFNLKDREDIYLESNFDNIKASVLNYASEISQLLGVFPYIMSLPVYQRLATLSFGSLFLGITLNIMIVVLFLLSVILIYNLLMVTLETRTLDFGVIRMLGLSKLGVGQLIFVQATSFVIPGVILGLVLSIPLLILVGSFLESKLGADIPSVPTAAAFLWSSLVGVLIPIVASYYPVKEALNKELNTSLDVVHSKTKAVQIKIEINSKKIPWAQITFGVLTVVFGVTLYILLPLSLLSFDLGLLLSLFFCILLGFLIGLSLLSLNFQHLMEKFVSYICFFWTSSPFRSLIIKNLAAHKLRNRQVAIMYALSLGFVIFIKVTLNQEMKNISYSMEATKGAYLEVSELGTLTNNSKLESQLNSQLGIFIESYAWITEDLTSFLQRTGTGSATVTHKGQLYGMGALIVGVSPSIFKTTIDDFLVIDEDDENSGLSLGEQLYTPRGSQGVILGEYYKDFLGVSVDIGSSVVIEIDGGVKSQKEELRVIGSLNSAPAFTFSNNPSVTNQHVLVSLPTFIRLANGAIQSIEDLPMDRLLIKVKGDTNDNLSKAYSLLNYLQQTEYPVLKIWDFRDSQSSLVDNQDAVNIIFITVEIVVIILSLFSLMTSMSTNILEQSKEIAVLRSLGVRRIILNMIFVSESFVLVFSSAIFGILIGTLVAWILAIQRILFTHLPLQFEFPYIDLAVVFIMAIISGFLSSYLPARRITRLQISKIIRLGA